MDKKILIGVDEVGCGAIAGPMCVAAVAAYEDWNPSGVRDSKKLSAPKREMCVSDITYKAIETHVEFISIIEIDKGFQEALMRGMRTAVKSVIKCLEDALEDTSNLEIIVDGRNNPWQGKPFGFSVRCEPKADDKYPVVSAASILAKVNRDARMKKLGFDYPSYKFAEHKGYPTKEHLALLEKHGPCLEHRRSSAPVKAVLEKRNAR